jgi:hypothetical protein
MNAIASMIKRSKDLECKKLYISCDGDKISYSRMAAAYLSNVLYHLAREKTIYVERRLLSNIKQKVNYQEGSKFEKIDIDELVLNEEQQCYRFYNDESVGQSVRILVSFIAKRNLVAGDFEEFLVTTIGEIFSNAFNHSEEDSIYFMYDIEVKEPNIYLVINITDFGKTIIGNVREYKRRKYNQELDSCECMNWAIQKGNTTRDGSGGYGLPTLKDYVTAINGELLIFSDDCIYGLKGNQENILDSKGMFSGTSVSMKIPLYDSSKIISVGTGENKVESINLDDL